MDKTPFLRSQEKLNRALLRLLKFCQIPAKQIFSTIQIEQEFFLIDRSLFLLHPDLVLRERAVFKTAIGESEDLSHYFEKEAFQLGISVKVEKIAPSQYKIIPSFEKTDLAIQQNILLIELMREVAEKHHLAALFHEKPFRELPGSGKAIRWSLITDTEFSFFNPENGLPFLILLTAFLSALHSQEGLLRASIGSSGNDERLGNTPLILGKHLRHFVQSLIKNPDGNREAKLLPDSPHPFSFSFSQEKLEFYGIGASAHVGFPLMTLQAMIADRLELILDEENTLRKHLKEAKVLFDPPEKKEQLFPTSFHAFASLLDRKSIQAFQEILSEEELHSYYESLVEQYAKEIEIDSHFMIEINPQKAIELERIEKQIADFGWEAKAKVFAELGLLKMEEVRRAVDELSE